MQQALPTGFLPDEDQGSVLVSVRLPEGASKERTDAVVSKVEKYLLDHPTVEAITLLGGLDILSGGINATNASSLFVTLTPFAERVGPESSAQAVARQVIQHFSSNEEALILAFNPPAIQGLGVTAGFEMQLQQRGGGSVTELVETSHSIIAAATEDPDLTGLRGSVRVTMPQVYAELNREKTKMLGVDLDQVFNTLQAYFGTLYVNDFSSFGRIWRVQMQAESRFRDDVDDINRIFVRNEKGGMVPLSAVVEPGFRAGPNMVTRFNGFPSVQINGAPSTGVSSGAAIDRIAAIASDTMPPGYGYEWSGETYQAIEAGNQVPIVLGFGLIVVFLVLAAQYERWSLPVVVLLAVPIAMLGALVAISLRGLTQDIYFQIGLLTLVGLSAKNAILIVEFCVELVRNGVPPMQAAIQAANLRFRPIVMTSLAFILGVVPLAISTGAGAAARHSIGTGVIGGMVASTVIAVFFIPAFFVLVSKFGKRRGGQENVEGGSSGM